MTYLCVVLYLACVYIRPGEIVPGWVGFPFVEVLSAVSAVAMIGGSLLRPRAFWNQPLDRYVAGFFLVAVLSNPLWGWFSGATVALEAMAPVIFCYFLLRFTLSSPARVLRTTQVLIALTLFQACNGIVQFHTGRGLGDVSGLEVRASEDDSQEEETAVVRRIRGTGIFNDPNDLALALVIVVPFLLGPLLRRGTRLRTRIVVLFALTPTLLALYYTNSRGGMLALAATSLPYMRERFGRSAGTILGAAAVAVLLFAGPSRMSELDPSESSAQGRVQSWAEGLQMFKAQPLFGVGFGRYTEFNELVAHNSFVHTLGELGLFGGFLFVGLIFWFFVGVRDRPGSGFASGQPSPETVRLCAWSVDLRRSGLALVVCMLFLSRQYSVILFVWLALSASYRELTMPLGEQPAGEPCYPLPRVAGLTFAAIGITYLSVRVFAVWS